MQRPECNARTITNLVIDSGWRPCVALLTRTICCIRMPGWPGETVEYRHETQAIFDGFQCISEQIVDNLLGLGLEIGYRLCVARLSLLSPLFCQLLTPPIKRTVVPVSKLLCECCIFFCVICRVLPCCPCCAICAKAVMVINPPAFKSVIEACCALCYNVKTGKRATPMPRFGQGWCSCCQAKECCKTVRSGQHSFFMQFFYYTDMQRKETFWLVAKMLSCDACTYS